MTVVISLYKKAYLQRSWHHKHSFLYSGDNPTNAIDKRINAVTFNGRKI
jgi:hypothetical protein